MSAGAGAAIASSSRPRAAGAAARACPLSYLDAQTAPIGGAAWPSSAGACWHLASSVVVIIAVLLVGASRRGRQQRRTDDALAVRRDAGGMRWIYIGVAISTVVRSSRRAIWTLLTLKAVARAGAARRRSRWR